MAGFRSTRLGLNDTARLLQVRSSELRAAILEEKPLRGDVAPPKLLYTTGAGGWVFLAGDVMDVVEELNKVAP